MDEIARLLAADEWPARGTPGRDLGWYHVATLPLPSGELGVGDPEFSWAELRGGAGVRAALEPGAYDVSAFVVAFGNGNFVARLRVAKSGMQRRPTRGAALARAGTDSAAIGVCDAREALAAFTSRFGGDANAAAAFLEEVDYQRVGVIDPAGNGAALIVYVNSGFGDGVGPVYELLDEGRRVGVEFEFIESGATA